MMTASVDSHFPLHVPSHQEGAGEGCVEVVPRFTEWPMVCGHVRLDSGPRSFKVRTETKTMLAGALWKALGRAEHDVIQSTRQAGAKIISGGLGRPLLAVKGRWLTNVSFAYSDAELWAVMCCPIWSCGIDVAWAQEFGADYPYHRAFSREELSSTLTVMGCDRDEAAALLWTAKEAVVKATGCGFHLVDPHDVRVAVIRCRDTVCELQAHVTHRGRTAPARSNEMRVAVRSARSGKYWVSVVMIEKELERQLVTAARCGGVSLCESCS